MSDSSNLHTFTVDATGESPTKTTVFTSDFKFAVDEPPALGGENAGPSPVKYLLGALAGCLNVVGHLVAEEMGIEMGVIEMRVEGDLDPAAFQGADTEARAGYETIRVELAPESDADQATLDEWLTEVEARCPVSDNVGNATPMSLSVSA